MNQLKSGVVLNYITLGLNTLVGLIYTPYMLRTMGQSEYGLYSLVASVIAYLTIMDFGFGNAIIRYTAKFRTEGKEQDISSMIGMFFIIYSIIGFISGLGGFALYLNVETLFSSTMAIEELARAKTMMLILTANLAFTFPLSIFSSLLTAYEKFIFPRIINISRIVLNTLTMVVLLHFGYKAVAMVVVQTIFNLSSLLFNFIYYKKNINHPIKFEKFNWDFLKEIWIYSFWIFLNMIMDRIYWSTGQFVLGTMVGTIAVAKFALAIQLEHLYMSFSTAIASVFLPKVSKMVASSNDNTELSRLFIRTGRIQYIVMAYILSGFIIFGKSFIRLWAGDGYDETYVISLLFFIALTPPLIQNLGITILQARNEMKFRSILYIGIASLSLLAQILITPRYSGIGCAAAIAGALILGQGLIMNIYYHKKQHLDITKFWKEIGRMSFIPILFTLGGCTLLKHASISTPLEFILATALYSAIYIPFFWKIGMNSDEKELIATPLKHLFIRYAKR